MGYQSYVATDITVLETWEAIRKRPTMYIGPLDDPGLPNRLLQEALCVTRSAHFKGEPITSISIDIFNNGRAVLKDDGPGWDVSVQKCGKRSAELILSALFACKEAKDPERKGLCNLGVVTLVALCSEFEFKTHREGHAWWQRFEKGRPVTAFTDQGPSTGRGTFMAFELDADILPTRGFDASGLEAYAAELRGDGLTVEVTNWGKP